jgi:hypothetical protein
MSTDIHAYPRLSRIPTFGEVTDLATRRLQDYFRDMEIPGAPVIRAQVGTQSTGVYGEVDYSTPAMWGDRENAWFYVPQVNSGAPAKIDSLDDEWRQSLRELTRTHAVYARQKDLIEECLSTDHIWRLHRAAGHPCTITVAYGMVAAAFCELTDGFLDIDDDAWDGDRFPATAQEFYTWYFRPDQALDPETQEWSARCVRNMKVTWAEIGSRRQ